LIIAGADVEEFNIFLIQDSSKWPIVKRSVDIANVIQNLCKLQGDKNIIDLGDIIEEESTFAKNIITNHLENNGILLNKFCTHLEKYAPKNLKPSLLDCVVKYHSYDQDLQILEGLLLEQIEDLSATPYHVIQSSMIQSSKNPGIEGEKVLKFYDTHPKYKVAGAYLLHTIECEGDIEGYSALNQLMLIDKSILTQVISLSKCIFSADKQHIKQQLLEILKAHDELLLLTPESATTGNEEAPLGIVAAIKESPSDADATDEKPTKALGDIEDC
jgi:hypothetical protein